jgi:monofunctional biosynthetic peptidoglycan transglycosylase
MKETLKKTGRFILKFLMWFLIVTVAWVILYRFINPPITPLMGIRWFEAKFDDDKTNDKIYTEWKDLEDISPYMPLAVMASEDQHFLIHHGFDFDAIKTAMEYNKTHKKKIGASTISQQVAKNVFLFPQRNFLRKGLEAYFTCLIEIFWSKRRIMEVYLNVIELNKNRFGVEQGGLYAFNRYAKNLTQGQCALIAAILPGPKKFSAKYPSGYIMIRQAQIIPQMSFLGIDVRKEFGYK